MTVFRSENCHRRSRLPERGPLPALESTSPVLESDPPSATSRSGPGAASARGRAGVSPAPCLLRPHAPSAERAFRDPLPPAPAPSFAHGPFAVRRCRARLSASLPRRDARCHGVTPSFLAVCKPRDSPGRLREGRWPGSLSGPKCPWTLLSR